MRSLRALLLAASLVLLAGCVRMPTEGPVVESQVDPDADSVPGIYYDPRPPQPGQTAVEVVSGFLEAMKATPIKTSVARQFLTAAEQEAWAPESRIITYAELGTPSGEMNVAIDLTDVNLYDERGAWTRTEGEQELRFTLTTEDGEWRIDQAPDALIVPDPWFDDWYQRVSLYFFDPTAEILVPEPVFVPKGEQFASSLVRGLLTPPTGEQTEVVRTFFPPGVTHGLSVPITTAGIADVTLSGDPDTIDEATAQQMLVQLVWTLRQEPRIRAVELKVGDRTFGTPGGPTQVNLDVGAAYDPTVVSATSDLFGLQDGLLVRGPIGSLRETLGPLGQADLGIRSIGVDLPGNTVAAVAGDGRSLLLAPVDQPEGRATQVLSGAVDLQTPSWDHRHRAWVLDRAQGRARVYVVGDEGAAEVGVPGVSGQDVTDLLVSRDGTRLVAVLRGRKADRVVAARIRQDAAGRVLGALPAVTLALPEEDSARIRDVAWRTPTTVSVVLSDITDDLSQVRTLSVDGAPGEIATEGSSRLRGRNRALVSSPVQAAPVYAVAGRTVTDLTTPELVLPDLPAGMRGLTYAG
jgi:hypothetical protein